MANSGQVRTHGRALLNQATRTWHVSTIRVDAPHTIQEPTQLVPFRIGLGPRTTRASSRPTSGRLRSRHLLSVD